MPRIAYYWGIAVGKVPHNVRFTADSKLAYVTLQGGASVAVVNMKTMKKIDEIEVPYTRRGGV